MAKEYLDKTGLTYFWGKLKTYFQPKLVSGTNIKTINNQSVLGSGNITIQGGGGGISDAFSVIIPSEGDSLIANGADTLSVIADDAITVTGDESGQELTIGLDYSILFNALYPVGSYYETSNTSFDPNVSWSGTWELDSAGKVTVARDVNDADFDTIGETGGSKYIQAHTHSFTQPKIPNHTHNLKVASPNNTGTLSTSQIQYGKPTGTNYTNDNAVSSSGGGGSCTGGSVGAVSGTTTGTSGNLQPYVVVNRWHRTA